MIHRQVLKNFHKILLLFRKRAFQNIIIMKKKRYSHAVLFFIDSEDRV